MLRQVAITASGVFANFGGVPLAFLFGATLGAGLLALRGRARAAPVVPWLRAAHRAAVRRPVRLRLGTVTVLGITVPVRGQSWAPASGGALAAGRVDALVRPEGLNLDVTRLAVLLSGDVTVRIDKPSAVAAAIPPGTSVSVPPPAEPVLIAPCA